MWTLKQELELELDHLSDNLPRLLKVRCCHVIVIVVKHIAQDSLEMRGVFHARMRLKRSGPHTFGLFATREQNQ